MACRGWRRHSGTQRRSAHDRAGYGLHAAHPEFVPAIVVLDPPLPGTATMACNKADRAGTAPYERTPARQWRLDGEGGGGGTERAVAVGRRGQRACGGGMERVVAGHGEGGRMA